MASLRPVIVRVYMFYVSVRLCLSPGERKKKRKKNKGFGLEEMDVISKLYSSVSQSVTSTVSQLSGVLPGNPVTREYEVSHQVASAGIGKHPVHRNR